MSRPFLEDKQSTHYKLHVPIVYANQVSLLDRMTGKDPDHDKSLYHPLCGTTKETDLLWLNAYEVNTTHDDPQICDDCNSHPLGGIYYVTETKTEQKFVSL